jgi:hypothetical protein
MNNHSFDDQIRQKAFGHEAPVPRGTWEAIAQKKKKRRRYPLFWWITGIAILSGGIVLFAYEKGSTGKSNIAAAESATSQPGNSTVTKANGEKDAMTREDNNINQEPVIQTSSATDEREVKPPVVVTERVRQQNNNKASASFTIRPSGIGQARSSNNNTDNGTTSGNDITDAGNNFSIETSGSLLNYPDHDPIAAFDREKQLKTDARLIVKDADSIMDRVDAIIADNTKKLSKKNKWTVDVSVMPFMPVQQSGSLLYLTRTKTEAMQTSEYKTDRVSTRLQPSLAYTISVHKRVNPKLKIGIGFQYALIKEKVDLTGKETRVTYTEVDRLVNGSGGPVLVKDTVENTSTGTLTIDALNSYRFISIPLSAQYCLMQRRSWSLQVNAGMLINISSSYHNSIEGKLVRFDNQGMHTSQPKNDIGLDIFAGLRVSKSLRSFSVFAEPMLRYNMRRYDLSDMINRKFMHQAGLSFGVSYTLRY